MITNRTKDVQRAERRQCWQVFGLLQPLLMVLCILLGNNDPNSLWSCAGLLLAVTFGISFPFLLYQEYFYQLGYGWE